MSQQPISSISPKTPAYRLLFSSLPGSKAPHTALEAEYQAAIQAGFQCECHDEHNGKPFVPADPTCTYLYRGFMLSPEEYEKQFSQANLINNTNQYSRCHYSPNYAEFIKNYSLPQISFLLDDIFPTNEFLAKLHNKVTELDYPFVVLKDFAKSTGKLTKIATDIGFEEFCTIVRDFFKKRGALFQKGFVFRRYEDLVCLTNGEPIQYRLWFLGKKAVYINCHSNVKFNSLGYYPPVGLFAELVEHIGFLNSNFFTMDLVLTANGEWIILEMGDGQVSGFPNHEMELGYPFYRALFNSLREA